MEGPLNMVTNVHTVADVKFTDTHVVTASFDSTAAIWECETGTLVRKFQGHVAAVFTVDFNEDVDVLVTGSADGTVKVNHKLMACTLTWTFLKSAVDT